MDYLRPKTLDEALEHLQRARTCIVSGGTDLYASGVPSHCDCIVDISGIRGLQGIEHEADEVVIGAATSWTAIQRSAALLPAALVDVAALVGSPQIQNRATIGGNICNAAAAADGIAVLLALDASVELTSSRRTRSMPLEAFVRGRCKTTIASDEILTKVRMRSRTSQEGSAFVKLGNRQAVTIALVSAAVTLRWRSTGEIIDARVAVGAASDTPRRARQLELRLRGIPIRQAEEIDIAIPELSPIDDVRASAGYRWAMAELAVRRACNRISMRWPS